MRTDVRRLAAAALLCGLAALARPAAADDTARRAPGTTFRDCPVCPEMVVVPPGTFVMGDPDGGAAERPAHRVRIEEAFALGRTEVTFDQWAVCVAEGGCAKTPDDHGWGRGDRPVINVAAADVRDYLAWLSRRAGVPYRLPSEAEWEYAARAGADTAYWWGDDVGEGRANCRGCGTPWSGKGTGPVASFAPNPWGLYDMHGNVWEWTADCWSPDHAGARDDAAPRTGDAQDCGYRVIRGGSWYYFSKLAGASYRARNRAQVFSYNIGFRVARDLE